MLRFARFFGLFVSICTLPVSAGCSRANKERVCQEHREVMNEFYGVAADLQKSATVLRKGAKVLEGLRGVPEADAYRRDLESVAEALDGLLAHGSSATEAYEEATRSMGVSAGPFAKFCYK
jgi:hypothetical protein